MATDSVVLIHGIAASRIVMLPLAHCLKGKGFKVYNWGYESLFASLEEHGKQFYQFLASLEEENLYILAHSMGCIVTRIALAQGALAKLKRLVFLAPPNTGSPLARLAAPVGRLFKPIPQLADAPTSLVNQLKPSWEYELGVIAAKFDLIVPEHCTHLGNEKDYILLKQTHNSLLLAPKVCALAERFFKIGQFS